MTTTTPLVEMRNVCKRYHHHGDWVLKDINLSIAKQAAVAIVGQSGSGKSTLLNILATLDEGTSGEYRFEGIAVSDLWPRALGHTRSLVNVVSGWPALLVQRARIAWLKMHLRRRMGFVFQTPFMLSNFPVDYNVALAWTTNKRSAPPTEVVRDMLTRLGLQKQARQTAETLSGGQRQRVAIGRALFHNPTVVFADEPTGNLDLKTAHEVMELLRSVCLAAAATLVLVTHQPDLACRYAERVIGIRDGAIAFDERAAKAAMVADFILSH
jgi:ABC-type lipoprotein export system ATPase subunit